MKKDLVSSEKLLINLWKEIKTPIELSSEENEKITLIYKGDENIDKSGPDFKNARIIIGNITFIGDVEIDITKNDWKNHGHHLNKRFNKVLIQIVFKDDNSKPDNHTLNGRKVKTIELGKKLEESLQQKILVTQNSTSKSENRLVCNGLNSIVDEKEKLDFIFQLGTERFKKKCDKMVHRLKEIVYLNNLVTREPVIRYSIHKDLDNKKLSIDELNNKNIWIQLFYENCFEALGYSQNKNIFLKLAQSIDINFINTLNIKDDFNIKLESCFFNVGGMIPDVQNLKEEESSEYTRNIYQRWSEIRENYTGRTFSQNDWHFFRLRPQNFPTIRIVGGTRILNQLINKNLLGMIFKVFQEKYDEKKVVNILRRYLITKSDGYWKHHFVFDKRSENMIKYFIGSNRADEIILNTILPFSYIYFELFDKKEFSRRVLDVYTKIKLNLENNIVKELSTVLCLNKAYEQTVLYFGMLELFRNYCIGNRCRKCKIGERIFN